uniref:hypothetical protein n=1 Tax=uncultured Kiloniella sp. TaxID=1133091 RepID=UPI00345971B1
MAVKTKEGSSKAKSSDAKASAKSKLDTDDFTNEVVLIQDEEHPDYLPGIYSDPAEVSELNYDGGGYDDLESFD